VPVYEYRCSAGHQYERTESFSAPASHDCEVCGKTARRLLSLPAIIFKGSGFYSTDNRKSAPYSNGHSSPDGASGNGHSHGEGGHTHSDKVEASAD
jgi:putative FmdB family regulatory protein